MDRAESPWPIFCIINGERAVKAVRTEEGDLAVLEYRQEHDDYRGAVVLHRLCFGDTDTEFVSEEGFELFVAQQHAGAKARGNMPPPKAGSPPDRT